MTSDYLAYALLGGLAIGLIYSVYSDVKYRLIYNNVTLPIALAAPFYWVATGNFGISEIAVHLLTAFLVFILFAAFMWFGMMGGGDVKLFAALALWFDWASVVNMMLITSLAGGIVTIVFLAIHKFRKNDGPVKIPYGVAISLGGLFTIGARFFNHFG